MLITARSHTTTQRLHSSKFTLVDRAVHSTAQLLLLRRTPFSNFVRMRTRSLVPKPKTTVIDLGARQVDTCNRGLTSAERMAAVWLALSLSVVVSKAYAVHTT